MNSTAASQGLHDSTPLRFLVLIQQWLELSPATVTPLV